MSILSTNTKLVKVYQEYSASDTEVNAYVHSHSASLDNTTDLVQVNSSTWNNVTAYQSNSANYLTAHQSIEGLMSASLLGFDENNQINSYNGSALAGQGGGTSYTGDAQGALDEVYANSGVWLTAHQSLTNYYTKTDTSSKQEISAALTGYQTKLASVNNIVYTASLPAEPDANTLYLIPEA